MKKASFDRCYFIAMDSKLNLTMEPGVLPVKKQACPEEKSMISVALQYIDWNKQAFPIQLQ